MPIKEEVRDAILRELKIVKQLITKLPDGAMAYRPSESQRSTLDLLRYLCAVGQGTMHAGLSGSFEWFAENNQRFKALEADAIPDALDAEMTEIERLFDEEITDTELLERQVDMQDMGKHTLLGWLLATTLKFVTAYKLQLFLYAKAAGNRKLSTRDCWDDEGP